MEDWLLYAIFVPVGIAFMIGLFWAGSHLLEWAYRFSSWSYRKYGEEKWFYFWLGVLFGGIMSQIVF